MVVGKSVYTTSADGSFILWDPKTAGALIKKGVDDGRFHQTGLTSSVVNKESQLALTGAEDGTLRLTHLETGKILSSFADHKESVEGLAFSDDPRFPFAVSGSVDGSICVWDMNTFQLRTSVSHEVRKFIFGRSQCRDSITTSFLGRCDQDYLAASNSFFHLLFNGWFSA